MHQTRSPRRRAFAAAILAAATPSLAATVDWLPTSPSPAPFSDPANWSTGSVPNATDAARFDTASAHTVTLLGDTTTDQLLLSTDDLTLDLAGHTYTLANYGALGLSMGSPTASSLTLLNSTPATPATLAAIHFTMSPNPGDTSSLTLTNGTTLAGYKITNVAYSDFIFGQYGAATVSLTNGARLDTSGDTTLAQRAGSSASVSLDGPDTRWTSYITKVASAGNAYIQITNGAAMTATDFYLGNDYNTHTASGSLTIDGPGSALQGIPFSGSSAASNNLHVGSRSPGSLALRNGGSATVNTLYLGEYAGATGTVTLDDQDTTLNAITLYAGGTYNAPGGSGTIDIHSGSFNISQTLKIWNSPGTSVNLVGGTFKLANFDAVSDLSRFHWTGGTLELTNSAVQVSNPTTVTPAFNYRYNPGPSLSLTAGMSLKLSSAEPLVVDNGGTLSADDASISVAGKVYVGYASTGTLALSNHASLSTSGAGIIGYRDVWGGTSQRGFGIVTLDDHSTWSLASYLTVGSDGGGTLAVRGGSAVSGTDANIASGPTASSATVDGPGSSWSSSGTLAVGKLGQGTLTISNGGAVSSTTGIVASSLVPNPSAVFVRGAASSWTNAATLYVAGGQTNNNSRTAASLNLTDHASVTTRSLAIGTNSTYAVGSVTLASNANLAVTLSAYLGGISTPRGTATLSLTDSSATIGTTLKIHDTPDTSLSLTRSTLTIGTPAAPGSLDNGAAITLDDHSTLTLHGTLAIAGTLSLSDDSLLLWDPAGAPDPLATLRPLLSTGRLTPASPDLAHRLGYLDTPSGIAVRVTLDGDANCDGALDADDYALIDKGFAQDASSWWLGDFDYDGQITSADYLLLDTAYGQARGFSPGFLAMRESQFGPTYVSALLTGVPEPSLLLCPLSSLLLRRRRTRPLFPRAGR